MFHIKNILPLLFITIISTYCTAQSAKSSSGGGDFGRYGDCSTGRGICGVGAENLASSKPNSNAKFTIEKKNESTIILKLMKANIPINQEAAVFGKAIQDFATTEKMYFKMDIDLPIDATITSSLKISSKYFKIPAGNYLLTNNAYYYSTEIKLQ